MSSEKNFILRHPKISAVVALGATAAVFGMAGHNSSPSEPGRNQGGNHTEYGDLTNHNPAGVLACQLTLAHQGDKRTDPYKLQAHITNGTAPKDATLTFQPKYQGGLSQRFNSFREDPVTVGTTATPLVAGEAFPPQGGDALPLASVRGAIAGTECAPAIAE
jgi:hypothetical protein